MNFNNIFKVEKYGEVTDFFNPGRGFAFITFSTNDEAQACIKGMDNTEVSFLKSQRSFI